MKKGKIWSFSLFIICLSQATVFANNIVVIGDSLSCGSFGAELFTNLSKQNSVTLYCAVSSAPTHWINGTNPSGQICQIMTPTNNSLSPCGGNGKIPPLANILSTNPDARVIVALGTNSLFSPQASPDYQAMALAVNAHGLCDWIGPPNLRPDQSSGFPAGRLAMEQGNLPAFYDSLQASLTTDCNLVDSRNATAPGTPGNDTVDGVHRTIASGIFWADQIDASIEGPKKE